MSCCSGLIAKFMKAFTKYKVVFDLLSLLLYIIDYGTDIFACITFYQQGDVVWASFTLTFIVLPTIINCIWEINDIIRGSESLGIWELCWMLVIIVFSPILGFSYLVWAFVRGIKGKENDDKAGFIKFSEIICEASPQACLQMYIIFQMIQTDPHLIGVFQWVTLSCSLISLAFGVCTDSDFANISPISRVTIFIFGLLAFISRLLICCLFSLIAKGLWFLPISIGIAISITIWVTKRFSDCSNLVPLSPGHHACNVHDTIYITLTWFLKAMFDSFTTGSILISIVNLGFAIAGYFYAPYPIIGIVAITLATMSSVANLLLISIPSFKVIGNDWIQKDADQEHQIYFY